MRFYVGASYRLLWTKFLFFFPFCRGLTKWCGDNQDCHCRFPIVLFKHAFDFGQRRNTSTNRVWRFKKISPSRSRACALRHAQTSERDKEERSSRLVTSRARAHCACAEARALTRTPLPEVSRLKRETTRRELGCEESSRGHAVFIISSCSVRRVYRRHILSRRQDKSVGSSPHFSAIFPLAHSSLPAWVRLCVWMNELIYVFLFFLSDIVCSFSKPL